MPVFLPGKSSGQRSLVSYSPWGHKELDLTEHIGTLACLLGSILWEILERGVSFSSVVLKLGCEPHTHTHTHTHHGHY